jgi:hypothetical protein
MRNYGEQIKEFYEYVWTFYNSESGIYPIASDDVIQRSVNQYLESKLLSEIYFDSHDREMVREIIQPSFQIFLNPQSATI